MAAYNEIMDAIEMYFMTKMVLTGTKLMKPGITFKYILIPNKRTRKKMNIMITLRILKAKFRFSSRTDRSPSQNIMIQKRKMIPAMVPHPLHL